jgi:hypothetical protein
MQLNGPELAPDHGVVKSADLPAVDKDGCIGQP